VLKKWLGILSYAVEHSTNLKGQSSQFFVAFSRDARSLLRNPTAKSLAGFSFIALRHDPTSDF
jgi:hypothetical protein